MLCAVMPASASLVCTVLSKSDCVIEVMLLIAVAWALDESVAGRVIVNPA